MTKPSKSNNANNIKKYSVLKQKILHILKASHENTNLINEWKKWLFQNVNVNVFGKNITGILIQIDTDHITLVNEFDIYIIPLQHVTFICKSFKK